MSKGGASKSTSGGITAWLLSQEAKVLCIDLDGQGNLTSMLTQEYDICDVFYEKTILEALIEEDVRPYTLAITDNLHIVPSNDFLANLTHEMLTKRRVTFDSITKALEPVMKIYDYIIIDTPPNLVEATLMGLSPESESGTYAVTMFDGSMFCYYAIPKFFEIVDAVNENFNRNVKKAGILFAVIDYRAKENVVMERLVDKEFPGLRFETVIRRKALEAYFNYDRILHGEAVAIGLLFSLFISERYFQNKMPLRELYNWLLKNHYPLYFSQINLVKLLQWMKLDKKRTNDTINFVLLRSIEQPKVVSFSEEEILNDMKQFFAYLDGGNL